MSFGSLGARITGVPASSFAFSMDITLRVLPWRTVVKFLSLIIELIRVTASRTGIASRLITVMRLVEIGSSDKIVSPTAPERYSRSVCTGQSWKLSLTFSSPFLTTSMDLTSALAGFASRRGGGRRRNGRRRGLAVRQNRGRAGPARAESPPAGHWLPEPSPGAPASAARRPGERATGSQPYVRAAE